MPCEMPSLMPADYSAYLNADYVWERFQKTEIEIGIVRMVKERNEKEN